MSVSTPYPSLAILPEVKSNGGKLPNSFLNPSWLSLRYDLGIPDDATITGTGPPGFSDPYYGALNVPALMRGGVQVYPAETVTRRIQRAFDLAANGPVGLIWDVRCSIGAQATPGSSGNQFLAALTLRRPGNLHVLARPGCGAILRPGTNAAMFANETPTFGTVVSGAGTDTATASLGGIAFGGVVFENLYLNANSGLVQAGYTSSANQAAPTFGSSLTLNAMRLWGVQDVTFKRCTIAGAAGFQLHFANWQRLLITDCAIDSLGSGFNGTLLGGNDCIHLNGPGDQCTIRDCLLASEDDYIAINTADGNTGDGSHGGPGNFPYWGPISRVRGYNLRSTRADNLGGNFVRVLANAGIANGGHEFDGLYGTIMGFALIDNSTAPGATPGSVGHVSFRNVNELDFTRPLLIGNGSTMAGVGRVELSGVTRSGSHLDTPLAKVSTSVAQFDIDGLAVTDDGTSGANKPQVQVLSGGSVADLSGRRVRLDGHTGQQNMPFLQIDSGGVTGTLKTDDVRSGNVLNHVVNHGTLANSLASGHRMANAGSGAIVANAGTWTNSTLSNTDPFTSDFTGTGPSGVKEGDYYGSGGGASTPAIAISPSSLAPGLTGQSIAVTGVDFTTATAFTLSGLSGTSITNTVIHSRTSATLTVTTGSTTGNATVQCSDFATATLTVASTVTTYLDDTFAGTTGSALTGNAATPANNGSDVWGTITGQGVLQYKAGGGVTSGTLTGGNAFAAYPLTGVPSDQTATWSFDSAATAVQANCYLHRETSGSSYLAIIADYNTQSIKQLYFTGGTTTNLPDVAATLAINTTYTLKAFISGTTLTLTLNGVAVGSPQTIPAGVGSQLLLAQLAGSAGDVTFHEVKVTSN